MKPTTGMTLSSPPPPHTASRAICTMSWVVVSSIGAERVHSVSSTMSPSTRGTAVRWVPITTSANRTLRMGYHDTEDPAPSHRIEGDVACRTQKAPRSRKELTRQRDWVNAMRRRLPMVKITREYLFDGPEGKRSLKDLFDGCRQ